MTAPLITIRATIERAGAKPVLLEIDSAPIPNPTPTRVAAEIDDAFSKLRDAVREEILK